MNFIKKHPEALPVSLAFVLLAILLVGFVWGIGYVFEAVNNSVNPNDGGNSQTIEFNLASAEALDLRGLLTATATGTTVVAPATPVPAATTTATTTATSSAPASSPVSSSTKK